MRLSDYDLYRAIRKDPKNEKYLLSLARSYTNNTRNAEAIAMNKKLINNNPSNLVYHTKL